MQTLLVESAIRATLIAAMVAIVLWIMRIKTASARHAVWASVVLVMMLLPAWVAWGPKAPLRVLPPELGQAAPVFTPLVEAPVAVPVAKQAVSSAPQPSSWNWLLDVYLLGVFTLLTRLAIGTLRANRLTSASCVVPITVGFLRPRVILPESSRAWPQAQLDAVLTHEGAHVRRRDPLYQWLALLNRAVFWFHPLAWWLERRLSGLAEEACDAAVLAKGHDPRDYSAYLLDLARSVERSGARVNTVAMAMPGRLLPQRIRRMLSGIPAPRTSWPRMACTVAVCATAAALFAAGTLVRAQPQKTPAAFDVVSVKPFRGDPRDARGSQFLPGGKFTSKAPLLTVIGVAYNIPFQLSVPRITGGPSWLNLSAESVYEIDASAAKGAVPDGISPREMADRMRPMLQALLADRFKLVIHRESKEMPTYALVVDKNGPKLPKADIQEKDCPDTPLSAPAATAVCHRFTGGRGRGLHAQAADMSDLVSFVQTWTDRPLFDKTGIKGLYKIETEAFQPMELSSTAPAAGTKQDGVDLRDLPTLFTVFERLGLRMESQKDKVDVYVIDHVERPSEN